MYSSPNYTQWLEQHTLDNYEVNMEPAAQETITKLNLEIKRLEKELFEVNNIVADQFQRIVGLKENNRRYEWISIEDRLPKDGELVFLAIQTTCNSLGWIYEIDHFYEDDGRLSTHNDASHWMPLFDPPSNKDAPDNSE